MSKIYPKIDFKLFFLMLQLTTKLMNMFRANYNLSTCGLTKISVIYLWFEI